MERERERDQRWPALSGMALDPLHTDDRPTEGFEIAWRRDFRRRLLMLGAVLAIWTAGIEARLTFLQVVRHDYYLNKAEKQHQDLDTLPSKRADIVDRNGELLAYSVNADAVVVNPRQVSDAPGTAKALCSVFPDCSAENLAELTARLRKKSAFEYLKWPVAPEVSSAVMALELPGIRVQSEPKRYYPKMRLAANVMGFVGREHKGLGGVELAFDSQISGKPGKAIRLSDGLRRSVDRQVVLEPTAGATLELTLDQTIQHIAERELKLGVEKHDAVSGIAVVMDPMTGEIFGSATYPSFNPNAPIRPGAPETRNRVVEDIYEPGSTFKIVTAAAAIEEGVLSTTDLIDTAPGHITVSRGRVVDDTHFNGTLTFEDVIVKSSNVGAIKAGWQIGAERLNRYVHRFGFGEILTKDFPGSTRGLVWPPEKLDSGALASVSMGYQIGVTPLQMVNAAAAVANGGTLFQPRIVRARIRDGKRQATEPVAVRQPISAATAATLTTIMEAVVERGTGGAARVDGYQVAGKTGTAQKNVDGRYIEGAYTGSFVGFVPSRRPVLAILVVIDEPRRGGYYGGVVAAPVFQRIAEASLRHLAIPRTINPIAPVIISADATLVSRPAPPTPEVQPMAYSFAGQRLMPSLTGLSARDAMRLISKAGLTPQLIGEGVVVSQLPEAGTPMAAGDVAVVHLERARPVPAPVSGGGS